MSETREAGTIKDVFLGKEDHGILTCWVYLDYFKESSQGFGGLALTKELAKHYVHDLCDTFQVKTLEELKGQKCYILKCFPYWNETIEGLESLYGNRFTITDFRDTYVPTFSKTPLESKKESLQSSIRCFSGRVEECYAELKQLDKDYKPWSKRENKK